LVISALEAGTQMLELDVHLTKDKVVVVSHDKDLSRCTGECVDVSSLEYEVYIQLEVIC